MTWTVGLGTVSACLCTTPTTGSVCWRAGLLLGVTGTHWRKELLGTSWSSKKGKCKSCICDRRTAWQYRLGANYLGGIPVKSTWRSFHLSGKKPCKEPAGWPRSKEGWAQQSTGPRRALSPLLRACETALHPLLGPPVQDRQTHWNKSSGWHQGGQRAGAHAIS